MGVYALVVRIIFLVAFLLGTLPIAFAQGGTTQDEDGNPIVYREQFELKGGEVLSNGQWPLPSGWTSHNVKKMGNGSELDWWRRKGGDFTDFSDPTTFYPRTAGEGQHNAALVANDAVAQAYLISPPWDLRKDRVANPALSFLYASNKRAEADELRLRYRLSPEGEWFDVVDAQNQPLRWGRQEEWHREVVLVKELLDRKGVPQENWGAVQFAFWGILHRGYGVCVDDVMIVDLEAKEITMRSMSYQGLSGAVGEGTELNEVALISMNVTPGVGVYRLKSLGLRYSGTDAGDVEKVSLYRTPAPYFTANAQDKLGELKLVNGTVTEIVWTNEDRDNKFGTGNHYFWVVVNIKNDDANAILKHRVKFDLPANAVSFSFKNGTVENMNAYLYPNATIEPKLDLVIYKTIYQTSFESSTEPGWQLENTTGAGGWRIGELSLSQPDLALTPSAAFSGTGVLATSKVHVDSKLKGFVERNQVRKAEYTQRIMTKNYSDVRMKLRYSLGLDPNTEFAVRVRPEGGDWEEVWTAKNRKTSIPWSPLPLSLNAYANRKESIQIGFQCKREDAEQQEDAHWGAFIDEVQVLGDYVRNDVGVSFVEPPLGFVFDHTAQIKVTVKNYGAETIVGPVPIRVHLSNGIEIPATVDGPINPGSTQDKVLSGLQMSPSLTGDNLMTLTVTTNLAQDDDPTNNSFTTRFYAFPTFPVSKDQGYPADIRKRMQHWHPTPVAPQLKTSWVMENVTNLLGEKKDKFKSPPFSAFVWTTGKEKCLDNESSVLTGPVLDLQGSEGKQLVVTYALSGGKLRFEYRTADDLGTWHRLEKPGAGFSEGWYDAGGDWPGATQSDGYRTAKVELPAAWNGKKVQLRAVFTHSGAGVAGAAINQVEVRVMRPDFKVVFDPLVLSGPGSDVNANGHVQFKIVNSGLAASEAFHCPVEITVYEHILAAGQLPPSDLSELNTLAKFEALGRMRIHGSKSYTASLSSLGKGAELAIDPGANNSVSALWNYPAAYYVVRIRIFPERVANVVDEDLRNNEVISVVLPHRMPHSVFRNVHAIYKKMYVSSTPSATSKLAIDDWYGRQLVGQGGGVRYPQIYWSPVRSFFLEEFVSGNGLLTPQNVTNFGMKPSWAGAAPLSALYDNLGRIKVRVRATRFTQLNNDFSGTVPSSTSVEPTPVNSYEEEIEIALDRSKGSVIGLNFSNQVSGEGGGVGGPNEREVLYACYKPEGESVTFRLKSQGTPIAANTHRLQLYANGQAVEGSPFTVNQLIPAGGTMDFNVPSVRIPAGYSRLDAWLESIADPEGTAQPITKVYQVYRWKAPDPISVLVRNENDPQDFYQLGYQGGSYDAVPYFGTKSLELYVVPTDRVQYQWYMGDHDATDQNLTIPVGNGSRVLLEGASRQYQLHYRMAGGGCEGRTPKITVRADDLELVNFAGPGGTSGICPDKNKRGSVEVVVLNNSRTTYAAGTTLLFTMQVGSGEVRELPLKTLKQELIGNGMVNVELDDLENLTPGLVNLTVELKAINNVADGNQANNKLTQPVTVFSRPVVGFKSDPPVDPAAPEATSDAAVVKRLFSANTAYHLAPHCSPDVVSYVWYRKPDFDGEEFLLNYPHRDYDIAGIPDDVYRLQVANDMGCTADATVRFIQTDFGVTGIASPKSHCALDENAEHAVVNLQNFGSKQLKEGTQADVSFWLDGERLASETVVLRVAMLQGDVLSYKLNTPMLREKLKGKSSVTVRAEARLKDMEDLDPVNDARTLEIKAYGYPKIYVQMSDIPNGTPLNPVTEGQQIVIYDLSRSFDQQAASGMNPSWDFQRDNQTPQLQIGTGLKIELPNSVSIDASTDKRGSGFYHAVVENEHVCQSRLKFELRLEAVDIAIEQVEEPEDACSFTEDMQLHLTLVNKSTVPIPMKIGDKATKLNFTVTDAEDPSDIAGDVILSQLDLEADWPVNGKLQHTITIPKNKLSTSSDEVVYGFQTVVKFEDSKWEGFDRQKDNNSFKVTVKDKPDVQLSSLTVQDKRLQIFEWNLTDSPEFVYEPVVSGIDPNEVTITANVIEPVGGGYTYDWIFDETSVIDKTSGGADGKKIAVFQGSGQVCLSVSGTDGACARMICGTIKSNIADIVIWNKIHEPSSICMERYDPQVGLPVQLVIKNVGALPFVVQDGVDPTLTLMYDVYFGSETSPVNSEPYRKQISLKGSKVLGVADGQGQPTQTLLAEDLPRITGLQQMGRYRVKFYFSLGGIEDGNEQNNEREHEFELYGAPELDLSLPSMAGWGHEVLYMEEASIGIPDNGLANAHSAYQWKRLPEANSPWGSGIEIKSYLSVPNVSYVRITEPGVYMLRFEDRKGCAGFAKKTVQFPGYIELVESGAFVTPKTACVLTSSEKVSVAIKNSGKEVYTKREIPLEFEMENPEGGNPITRSVRVSLPSDLAPGSSVVLSTDATFDLSQPNVAYKLQAKIGPDDPARDAAELAGKANPRELGKATVEHLLTPQVPDVAALARAALDAIEPGIHLDRIPRKRSDAPVIFDLDGLVPSMVLTPNQAQGLEFEWSAGSWTAGKNPKQPLTQFNASGDYKVTVGIRYQVAGESVTCSASSESVYLGYATSYTLASTMPEMKGSCLLDESRLPVEVKSTVTLAAADEPLAEGSVVKMTYRVVPEQGGTVDNPTATQEYTLPEEMQVGGSFDFTFDTRPQVSPGRYKVSVSAVFTDKFGELFVAPEIVENLHVPRIPVFKFPNAIEEPEVSPFQLSAPALPAGDTYTYSWNSGAYTTSSIDVRLSGTYELTVTTGDNCSHTEVVAVRFLVPIRWVVKGQGSVSFGLLDGSGNVIRQLENDARVPVNSRVKVVAKPDAGHKVHSVLLNKSRQSVKEEGYEAVVDVAEALAFEIAFSVKKTEEDITSVESDQLSGAYVVSPFDGTLTILGADQAVRYEVVNQLGLIIHSGVNREGADRIEVSTPFISDGLYLVRLHDRNGGVLTLRAVRVRR